MYQQETEIPTQRQDHRWKFKNTNNKTERKNKQTVPDMHINAHEEKRLNMQKKDISSHNKGQTWKKTLKV
jgi:hypothetical protein